MFQIFFSGSPVLFTITRHGFCILNDIGSSIVSMVLARIKVYLVCLSSLRMGLESAREILALDVLTVMLAVQKIRHYMAPRLETGPE